MSPPPDQLLPGALCTLLDVTKRVPGYEAGDDPEIDEILTDLIVQESADFMEATGREIVAVNTDTSRIFDLTASIVARRTLPIGDAAAVTSVELFDYDGATSLGVIAANLYVLTPRIRATSAPATRLNFPRRPSTSLPRLAPGRTLRITATWGFPAIPVTVVRAVAVFVIFRYLNDVAASGTRFAELASQADVDLAASLRAALDARDRLRRGPFA